MQTNNTVKQRKNERGARIEAKNGFWAFFTVFDLRD